MDTAQNAPETVILTQDEAWMYLQATTQRVWSPCGQTPHVRVDPGREKVGFYASLDLRTGQDIVMRSTQFNAQTSAQHLQQVLDTYPDRPILFLWDRAPWHHGPAIRTLLTANPRLELMCYPVAAPDLNPQEGVWKKTRQAISHNHLFDKLPTLADRFEEYLTNTTFESSFLEHYGYHLIYSKFN